MITGEIEVAIGIVVDGVVFAIARESTEVNITGLLVIPDKVALMRAIPTVFPLATPVSEIIMLVLLLSHTT